MNKPGSWILFNAWWKRRSLKGQCIQEVKLSKQGPKCWEEKEEFIIFWSLFFISSHYLSNFLEHRVTFYQVCNTITWWFDNIVNKGDLRNQLLTLTLTSNFLVLDNNFRFKIYIFYFVTVSYRLQLHRCLLLPQNRPLLRPSNRYVFDSEQQQGINNLLLEKYYQYYFLKTSR